MWKDHINFQGKHGQTSLMPQGAVN